MLSADGDVCVVVSLHLPAAGDAEHSVQAQAGAGQQGARSVLGELQQNGAGPAARHVEGFDSWAARKQLQSKVEALQAKVKVTALAAMQLPVAAT